MTIIHPRTVEEARAYVGEYRAGGTDVEARRRLGMTAPVTIDLRRIPGMSDVVATEGGGTRIGAMVRVRELARLDRYPALAVTAGSLANPHTRAVGTLGGNLLQATRCWYFRTGEFECHKTGADACPARAGIHHFGNVFDTSSCVAPHPSSLAMALSVYDAEVDVDPGGIRPIADLYDPIDPTSEHRLTAGEVLTAVVLPPPVAGERAAYRRVTARAMAEWPIVEAVCAVTLGSGGEIDRIRIAVGGVGPVPRRLPRVEEQLAGTGGDLDTVATAVRRAADGARPAPQAAAKLPLLQGVVADVIERAMAGEGHSEVAAHELP